MPNHIRRWYRLALNCSVVAGSLLSAAVAIGADSDSLSTSTGEKPPKLQTPMTDRGPMPASYSDRLRITGFLARQHTREGNTWRALTEFFSMLNVDDPTWTDDEAGDSMRIARDIEVAQMMTEVGFFEYAVRILHTSLILACVDQDPQAVQVQSQLLATTELAHVKGIAVPEIDMSFLFEDDAVKPASLDSQPAPVDTQAKSLDKQLASSLDKQPTSLDREPESSESPAVLPDPTPPVARESEAVMSVTRNDPVEPERPIVPPAELPKMKSGPAPAPAVAPASPPATPRAQTAQATDDRSDDRAKRAWWSPSRWRQKKDITPAAVTVQEDSKPDRRATSPNVAPTYCQECSGLHGSAGTVVVRYNPRTGITHAHIPGQSAPSEMPSPYQKQFAPIQPGNGVPPSEIAPPSTMRNKSSAPADENAVASAASNTPAQANGQPAELSSKLYNSRNQSEASKPASEPVQQDAQPAMHAEDGPALTGTPEPPARKATAPKERSSAVSTRAQVGIAGEVSNPGIFALQGRSTTLAALLRRTGDASVGEDKKARILRAVDYHEDGSNESHKDYYCQRLDGSLANSAALDTPVFSQEIVIVDGAGDKPVYVAVMPHFILQVPVEKNSTVTSEQILERLSVHWPEIRNQNIGVLRYEEWGSTATTSRAATGGNVSARPLAGGDVFYVDGTTLDKAQVIPAAESIAKMAGARLRKLDAAAK